jgi:HTH-type transcriptional regulator, glycine betaine synthesis regulator
MSETPDPRQRAIDLAGETMAEVIEFWGFKGSMGRIWTLLYLSPRPMSADEIKDRTGLSAGAVSMAVSEMLQWGILERAPVAADRKKHYQAETDVWALVRRIVRDRELRLVARAVQRFEAAVAVLEDALVAAPGDPEILFMLDRLRGLLSLTRTGYTLVESFAALGWFSLDPIRGALNRLTQGVRRA